MVGFDDFERSWPGRVGHEQTPSSFQTRLPPPWRSPTVEDADDEDSVVIDLIEYAVGEFVDARPSQPLVNGDSEIRHRFSFSRVSLTLARNTLPSPACFSFYQ
jgi:hypothetical protein